LVDDAERVVVRPTNFLNSLARAPRNRSRKTLDLYAHRIVVLCRFLEDHPVYGQIPVDEALTVMGLPLIDEFYRECQARGLGASSVRGHEVVVKLLLTWLTSEEAGRAREAPLYSTARTPTPLKRVPRYMVVPEVTVLLKGMHWEMQRLVTHFIFDTGLRVSEVPRVLQSDLPNVEHYDASQMYFPLLVRGSKGRGGETKERYTIISRPMLMRVRRYHSSRTYFTNHDWPASRKPAFLNTYGDALLESAIQSFIDDAKRRTGLLNASPHRLRHGTAYSVLRSEHGKTLLDNLLILQRVLGHSDISTTEIYTHIPAPVLQRMTTTHGAADNRFRFEEAQKLFDETFLPEKKQRPVRRIGVQQ